MKKSMKIRYFHNKLMNPRRNFIPFTSTAAFYYEKLFIRQNKAHK